MVAQKAIRFTDLSRFAQDAIKPKLPVIKDITARIKQADAKLSRLITCDEGVVAEALERLGPELRAILRDLTPVLSIVQEKLVSESRGISTLRPGDENMRILLEFIERGAGFSTVVSSILK